MCVCVREWVYRLRKIHTRNETIWYCNRGERKPLQQKYYYGVLHRNSLMHTHTLSLSLSYSFTNKQQCVYMGREGKEKQGKNEEKETERTEWNKPKDKHENSNNRERSEEKKSIATQSTFTFWSSRIFFCVLQMFENRDLIEYEVNNSFKRICNCEATTRCDVYRLLQAPTKLAKRGTAEPKKKKKKKEQSIRLNESIQSKSHLKLIWILRYFLLVCFPFRHTPHQFFHHLFL